MEMTHLRYWMPLVIEGNKRGIQSNFYVGPSNKYNCPVRYQKMVTEICKQYNINLLQINQIRDSSGLLFSCESRGLELLNNVNNCKKIISTYQTDFVLKYEGYIKKVDHVLMPSKFSAEYYNKVSSKNLCFGIPKFDVVLQKDIILKKYNLSKDKKVLIIWPKGRDEPKVDMGKIMDAITKAGYMPLAKTRGKDPFDEKRKQQITNKGGFYFGDDSWFPHTTQELLEISDVAINFGSTAIEECVMSEVPLINFDIKPAVRHAIPGKRPMGHEYLYKYEYCKQLEPSATVKEMANAITTLAAASLTDVFKQSKKMHLFENDKICKNILDALV